MAAMSTVARDARDATESSNVRFRSSNKKAKSCLKMSENGNRAMLRGCLDDLGRNVVRHPTCGAGRSTTPSEYFCVPGYITSQMIQVTE